MGAVGAASTKRVVARASDAEALLLRFDLDGVLLLVDDVLRPCHFL